MQNHTCLQRRAGVRARGKNSGYGQPKGGRKGGRNPLIIINTLIFNIFVMDCGAPTRTRTADLLITNQCFCFFVIHLPKPNIQKAPSSRSDPLPTNTSGMPKATSIATSQADFERLKPQGSQPPVKAS